MTSRSDINLETWMTDFNSQISNVKLNRLILPATHDSGSFSRKLTPLPYARNQDKDLQGQLLGGIRCFDLRIGKTNSKPNDGFTPETYYFHHGTFTANDQDLQTQLSHLVNFAITHPTEIVIIGVSHYEIVASTDDGTQFSADKFAKYIKDTFVDNVGNSILFDYTTHSQPRCPTDPSGEEMLADYTVGDVLSTSQNVIVIGDEGAIRDKFWSKDSYLSTWDYTNYISDASMNWGIAIDQDTIRTCSYFPLNASTDQPYQPQPDGCAEVPGFFAQCLTLLTRRATAIQAYDAAMSHCPPNPPVSQPDRRLAGRLLWQSYSFTAADIEGLSTTVHDRAQEWTERWHAEPATKNALNIIGIDFFDSPNSDLVRAIVRLNSTVRTLTASQSGAFSVNVVKPSGRYESATLTATDSGSIHVQGELLVDGQLTIIAKSSGTVLLPDKVKCNTLYVDCEDSAQINSNDLEVYQDANDQCEFQLKSAATCGLYVALYPIHTSAVRITGRVLDGGSVFNGSTLNLYLYCDPSTARLSDTVYVDANSTYNKTDWKGPT